MKMIKRGMALFLFFLMLSSGPISAFATEGVSDNDVVVETPTPAGTEETVVTPSNATEPTVAPTVSTGPAISTEPVDCSECNQAESHAETCSQYVAPTEETNEPTTAPSEETTEPTEETTEPTVGGVDVICSECGATEGHTAECSQYIVPVLEETKIETTVDGLRFVVEGNLPVGTTVKVEKLDTDVNEYIHHDILALEALADGYSANAYDITLIYNEEEIQPDASVTVTMDGTDTTGESVVEVYHLADTSAEDVYAAYMEAQGISTMSAYNAAEEKVITGSAVSEVYVGEGYIQFVTSGFSVYYVVAGSQSDNSGNDTFNILRGTSVELTNVTSDNYTVTYPSGVTAEDSGVTLVRSGNTLTITATSTAKYGTYTVEINDRRTATIVILSPREIFDIVANNDVYFTCVRDSTNVPSEPMSGGNYNWTYITGVNNGNYEFTNTWGGAYQNFPDGFLNLETIANSSALKQNLKGQNVIGVIDSGWGADTLPCINYTDEQWHELLKQFVEYTTVQISDGAGGTVTLTSSMVDEKLENGTYRYKMFPYVVKLILESSEYQKGWHVDCAVVDTKTYSVSYEYNLPSSAVLQESSDLIKPEMAFYSPGTDDVKVGVMTLGRNNVTGDTSVTVYDTNTQSTSEYKFLYWNTAPDGSGTSYSPDDTLPAITENVALYAIWNHTQTSGTLKLQKTEVFEDANDERKDDGANYTFTVIFANAEAGKSYPYTIYNADNTVKSAEKSLVSGGEIVLQAGEYAVVNNVPGGSVTVSESVATDSEFDVSWNVAGSKTEGSTVTATVTAGNQTEIVCVNTYSPLVADLTITKTGWNTTDENQSFIFDVTGPNGFKLTVTINGNGSVTIENLPIGAYTVTENTDWSWRYTPANKSETITLVAGSKNEVAFANKRSWIYWLSGDSYNENQFTVKTKDEE